MSDNKIHHYFNEVINEHYKLKLIPEDHLKKFLYNKTFVEKIQDHVLTLSEEEDAEKIDQALSVFLSHSNIQTRKFIVEGHETHKNDIADKIKYDIFEKAKTKINDLCLTEQQKEEEQLGKGYQTCQQGISRTKYRYARSINRRSRKKNLMKEYIVCNNSITILQKHRL